MTKSASYRIVAVMLLGLAILCILMLWGMRYPVVGRNDIVAGIPNSLIVWGAVCATVYSGIMLALTHSEWKERSKLFGPIFGFFLAGTILWTGALMLFNGIFDRSEPRVFQAAITQKYIHRFRGTDYFFVVQDWQNPNTTIRLRVDPQTYQQYQNAVQINVTTAAGALGFERLIHVQP
jgi:hypothetical protein